MKTASHLDDRRADTSSSPTDRVRPSAWSAAQPALAVMLGLLTVTAGSPAVRATNLEAVSLEITQGIQDAETTAVPLIAGRSTYVRFHVAADEDVSRVDAKLVVTHSLTGKLTALYPVNAGGAGLTVKASPDRGEIDDSFLFEIPDEYTGGMISFRATLDPDDEVSESNESDNVLSTWKYFQSVPTMKLKLYKVAYDDSGATVTPGDVDTDGLASWLRRAFPVSDMDVEVRSLDFGSFPSACGDVNGRLALMRLMDHYTGISWDGWTIRFASPGDTRYYGMVHDNDDPDSFFMRGCAMAIPTYIASGPTGEEGWWPWDTDGTYGDWYGGHELGHAYGRCHAEFCGATDGCADQVYEYDDGYISDGDLYGFDVGDGTVDPQILSPDTWTDVMTYCDNEWISDFTYEGIIDRMRDEEAASSSGGSSGASGSTPQMLIVARVDLDTGAAAFDDVYVVRSARAIPPSEPGDYEIRMTDNHGTILASHFVKGHVAVHEGGAVPPHVDLPPPANTAAIAVMLPFEPRTYRIDLLHQGRELATRVASPSAPMARVLYPNGGESLGNHATVRWAASDPDGQPLSATLQISGDDGEHWVTVDTQITGNSYKVRLSEWPTSATARFRVLVTDGFHTTGDSSDESFAFGGAGEQ